MLKALLTRRHLARAAERMSTEHIWRIDDTLLPPTIIQHAFGRQVTTRVHRDSLKG